MSLVNENCGHLSRLVEYCIQNSDDTNLCPSPFAAFIADLARRSPIPQGLIRNVDDVIAVLDRIPSDGVREQDRDILQKSFPSLYDCWYKAGVQGVDTGVWINLVEPVLPIFRGFCQYLDSLPPQMLDNVEKGFGDIEYQGRDIDGHSSCFPGAPVIRGLNRFCSSRGPYTHLKF